MSDEVYEVERILQAKVHRKKGKKVFWKYLVKWKGYGIDWNTWEPPGSFNTPETIANFWRDTDTQGRDVHNGKLYKVGEVLSCRSVGDDDTDSEKESSPTAAVASDTEVTLRKDLKGCSSESAEHNQPSGSSNSTDRLKRRRDSSLEDSKPSTDSPKRPMRKASKRAAKRLELLESGRSKRAAKKLKLERSKDRTNDTRSPSIDDMSEAMASDANPPTKYMPQVGQMVSPRVSEDAPQPMAIDSGDIPSPRSPLFSEEDEAISNLITQEDPIELGDSIRPSSLFSEDEDEAIPNPIIQEDPVEHGDSFRTAQSSPFPSNSHRRSSPTVLPSHRARAANPLVKFLDDPLEKNGGANAISVKARFLARRDDTSTNGPSPSTSGAGMTQVGPADSSVHESMAISSSSSARQRPTNDVISGVSTRSIQSTMAIAGRKSSLLTFRKGKLRTEKGGMSDVNFNAQGINSTVTASRTSPLTTAEPPQDIDSDLFTDTGSLSLDFDPASATVPDLPDLPPPTAAELLQLAGVRTDGLDDLSDFDADADGVDASVSEWENTTTQEDPPTFSFGMASGPLATGTGGAWRQSTIFGAASPLEEVHPPFSVTTTGNTTSYSNSSKFAVLLNLDSLTSISVLLKDISSSAFGSASRLDYLLEGQPSGPPGKLYPEGVLDHVKTGGSSARISMDETSTSSEKQHFNTLRQRLEENKLFIAVIGGHVIVFCSSQNRAAGQKLGIHDSVLGLPHVVLMTHVLIENHSTYADCAMTAEDLTLSRDT